MDFKEARYAIGRLYRGLGWPAIFGRIRFFTAPYQDLMSYIPAEGFIVDLGCGYGLFSNLLALMSNRRQVLGLDLDAYKIKFANRGLPNAFFKFADVVKTVISPADCILLIHVLHHFNSYEEQDVLLRVCYDKLKVGGTLLICEVQKYPRWKYLLSKLADFLLYPGEAIFYRFPKQMLPLLKTMSPNIQNVIMHQGTPFSHITYIVTKV